MREVLNYRNITRLYKITCIYIFYIQDVGVDYIELMYL